MSKAVAGAAMLAAGIGLALLPGGLMAVAPFLLNYFSTAAAEGFLITSGAAMAAGAIADALMQNRGMGITTRQPASFRQIIYGEQRVGGIMVYESTTGSHLDQYNMIIVLATHEVDSVVNLYLDGRQVHWNTSSSANVNRNGVNFGGSADGNQYTGPGGAHYNFGGLVYCDVRFGDQADGDVMPGMTSNDPNWAASDLGAPFLGGCTYIYLKVEYNQAMFPQMPEVRVTIRGKNNIVDPRITSSLFQIPGSVTSGVFQSLETAKQTTTGATVVVYGSVPSAGPMAITIAPSGGPPDATDTWVGQTSGAVFTPTSTPVDTGPIVLERPTVLTNGWAGNAQEAEYEEGVNQGFNWGFNSDATPGYNDPQLACDGAGNTAASIVFQHMHQYAGCIWSFAALAGGAPSSLWLNVNSMVNAFTFTGRSAGVWYSIDGGTSWTQIYDTMNHAQGWDSVELTPTMDTSQLRVMAFTDAHDDMAHYVYDIQLATGSQAAVTAATNEAFTTNWALIIADILQDDQWGLGDIGSVNVDQLVAAANVCDETINSVGGPEAQWTCNYHYDTGTGPGDILETMMPAAAGRLSRIGGEWFIWPAYWQGPSFTFDESILTDGVKVTPFRKQRELFNRVNGTYIAANFPYNVAGNLYDANGWYDGSVQNNFPFAFQPTNYPQFAADPLHGYTVDIYLAQDGGIQLPKEVVQNCVLSVSQAQRAAKVILLRNRLQMSCQMSMHLEAWQMQPTDVMLMTLPAQGWTQQMLEVVSTRFSVEEGDDKVPVIKFQVGAQEASPYVYEWSAQEEMTVYDVAANPQVGPGYIVPPPTSVSAASNETTALTGADGTITPRILLSWVDSADATIGQYNIQYQVVGSGTWITAPTAGPIDTDAFISGVVSGTAYNIQIQAQRTNGATSEWVATTCTAEAPNSTVNSYVLTPQFDLTNPDSTHVDMGAVSAQFGSAAPVNYSARTFGVAVTVPTWYYITIADPTQQGETSATLTATCQTSNALVGVIGNTYIGAIQAIPGGGSDNVLAGGWPAPTTVRVGT